jgi:23S rRNA (cytosine1962-C5)-methyltransferase
MIKTYLKQGREAPVLRGHPWIFSGALDRVESDRDQVGVADVFDSGRRWLARGLYNPKSQIRVRVLTSRDEEIGSEFFSRRLAQALLSREQYFSEGTNAYRLVNGEGDFLPGLIVDRYDSFFVCQFLTAGIELFKAHIAAALTDLAPTTGVFERSEGRVRQEEGVLAAAGTLTGETPAAVIAIKENGFKFLVDVKAGQKTGFFLDQRDNRALLSTLARGRSVLNCFSYTGAFSVYALAGGATEVTSLDSSRPALELAEQNVALNGFANSGETLKGDAFAYLKETTTTFDAIVLDPPSLAHRRSDVSAATGAYKFLNLHALKHLNPGGVLMTFSCSQHLSADLFQKVVFGAAVDAGRKVAILKRLGHPPDHPVSLHHPEGEYLKGLAVRVLE